MPKRKFLMPVAAVFLSLSANADASALPSSPATDSEARSTSATESPEATLKAAARLKIGEERELLIPSDDKLFSFVIRRAETGQLFVGHHSHRSHYSSR